MTTAQGYEAVALGLTPEGTTPGRRTLTEGLCSASDEAESETHPQPRGGGARPGGGREREALRPGIGAEPQGRSRRAAGGRVTPPAKDQQPAGRLNPCAEKSDGIASSHPASKIQIVRPGPPPPKTTCEPPQLVGRRVDALAGHGHQDRGRCLAARALASGGVRSGREEVRVRRLDR